MSVWYGVKISVAGRGVYGMPDAMIGGTAMAGLGFWCEGIVLIYVVGGHLLREGML